MRARRPNTPANQPTGSPRAGRAHRAWPPWHRCRYRGSHPCSSRTTARTGSRSAPARRERAGTGDRERAAAAARRSTHVSQLALEILDLVTQTSGVLEAQLRAGVVHLLLEGEDQPPDLVARELGEVAPHSIVLPRALVLPGRRRRLGRPQHRQDVGDRLADRLRV